MRASGPAMWVAETGAASTGCGRLRAVGLGRGRVRDWCDSGDNEICYGSQR